MALLDVDRYNAAQGVHPIAAENPLKTLEPGLVADLKRKAGLMLIAANSWCAIKQITLGFSKKPFGHFFKSYLFAIQQNSGPVNFSSKHGS